MSALARRTALLVFLLLTVSIPACAAKSSVDSNWTTPVAPFKIADGLYYVGSRDLASYLVTTPQGDILVNANYTTSPPQIRRSVEQLGFRWRDIRILLISHAHVDHAGGAAQILRETGAKLEVMEGDTDVMESGGDTDFAFGGRRALQFPPAHVSHTLHDGEQVTLGGITLTAHRTPGHTRGCTSWSMRVHVPGEPAGTQRDVVITGSWTVLPSYRLLGVHGGKPPSYPGIASDYTLTFSVLRSLPCDIFLAAHASQFAMQAKLQRMPTEGDRVWIDPEGYRTALAAGQHGFEAAYRQQSASAERGDAR